MDKTISNQNTSALLDLAAIVVSFLLANVMRYGVFGMGDQISQMLFGAILCAYLINFVFFNVKIQSPITELSGRLKKIVLCNARMLAIVVIFMFAFKISYMQSRFVVGAFFVWDIVLMLLIQSIYKRMLVHYYRNPAKCQKLVLFTNEKNCLQVLHNTNRNMVLPYDLAAIVVMGAERPEQYYRVKRRKEEKKHSYLAEGTGDVMDFLTKEVVDEVLLSLPDTRHEQVMELISKLEEMGITVHLTINTFNLKQFPKSWGRFGAYSVLDFYEREFTPGELFVKRAMDIAVGLVGCLVCVLVGIFVCPAIYLEDPGPVVFRQRRVGRNGRFFYIYKFRSMYQDAEERKKELMAQNEMHGLMFKIKDDPRITKVGKFIRKTSLDEFPQFFNVLFGSMSIVGTRPPTVDEFEQYSMHHKRRLQMKPGITGLWQVSGRSDIQDFDEVVKLDCQYIDEQSIWLDIKILFQTVKVVLLRKGAD